MDDKQLLRFAARAAGMAVWTDIDGNLYSGEPERQWNPLTDDGDALRLAVVMGRADRLGLAIHIVEPFDGDTGPYTWIDADKFGEHEQYHGDDPFGATRRAIVMAAAKIGVKYQ